MFDVLLKDNLAGYPAGHPAATLIRALKHNLKTLEMNNLHLRSLVYSFMINF